MSERRIMNSFFVLVGTPVVPGIAWMGWNFVSSLRSSRLHVFDRLCRLKWYELCIYPLLEFHLDDRSFYWDWVV